MAVVDNEDLKAVLGPVQSVDGKLAGFGVRYMVEGGADLSSPNPSAKLRLDESSLKHAEEKSGANQIKSKVKTGSAMDKAQDTRDKADDRYADLVQRRAKQPFGHRANYRHSLSQPQTGPQVTPAKGPLLRAKNRRRLLELRKTFDEIKARKEKSAQINPKALPITAQRKLVEEALVKGATTTPFGPIGLAMKMTGFSEEEQKFFHKKMFRDRFIHFANNSAGWLGESIDTPRLKPKDA